jgi:O-antigen ligase
MNALRPVIIQRAQWLGLLALLVLPQLCFWQDSTDPFAPVELALIKVLVPLALLPWLLGAGEKAAVLVRSWPARLLLGWAAWLWVSAILSPFSADGFKTALEYGLYASAFWLPAVCSAPQRRALLWAFFGASLLAALYGIAQHFHQDPWMWSTDFTGRPLGTIGNPNFFGGHLVLAWGLGLGWLLAARPGQRRWPLLAFGTLSLVQWYSRSVGPWLGMAASALLALGLLLTPAGAALRARNGLTRGALLKGLGALALVLALLFASPFGQSFRGRMASEKGLSVTNRLMMWRVATDLWKTAPLQGAGLGAYRPLYPKFQAAVLQAEPKAGWNYVVTWLPHENYLYLLCETGLIGLGLFLAFWGAALWQGLGRAVQGDREALMALLAAAGLLGSSLLNTFSNIAPTALGFFFLCGLLAWSARPEPLPERRLSTEALVAALIATLVLGVPPLKELVANRLTREAGRYAKRGDNAGAVPFARKAADQGHINFTPQSLVGVNFQLGEALRNSGQIEAAIAAYREDLKANPWAPEVHNMLGAALGQWGTMNRRADWVSESADHLRLADELNPGYAAALLNLGGSYMILGNYSGAATAWEKLLTVEPNNEQAKAYLQQLKGKH